MNEQELKLEIEQIRSGEGTPVQKAKRLMDLRRRIDQFSRKLQQAAGANGPHDPESLEQLRKTARAMKRLQEETRLAAFRVLRARPVPLGLHFDTEPSTNPSASPVHLG